jgi:hypothetical protein
MRELEHSLQQHGIEISGWVLPPPGDPWCASVDECDEDYYGAPIEDRGAAHAFLPYALEVPIEQIAESKGHPVEAYQLALLCVAASLIPSQVRLVVDSFSGTDAPPILWGGLVGEPGCGVLDIIRTLTQPLANLRAVKDVLSEQSDHGFLIEQYDLAAFLQDIGPSPDGRWAHCLQWLKAHSGDVSIVGGEASRGVLVQHSSVSVIGRIWPSAFRSFFQGDDLLTDKLWKSFVWVRVHPTSNPNTRDDSFFGPSYLYRLLKEIYGRIRSSPPTQHVLSRVGQWYWREWCREIEEAVTRETDRRIRFSLFGMPEQAARVALVLHRLDAASDNRQPSTIVSAHTLFRAIWFVRRLQEHAVRIHEEVGRPGVHESESNGCSR